jgi:hypothetical protein
MDRQLDATVNRDLPEGEMFAAYTVPVLQRPVRTHCAWASRRTWQ